MADKTDPKATPAPSGEASANKAQAEFQRYKDRLDAERQAFGGFAPMAMMPGWAVPPSVVVPQAPWGAGGHEMPPGPIATGSLGQRLGSTVRLGVDVVNLMLAGGVRMLGGLAGGYEAGWQQGGHGSYGCGCGCGDECGVDCCRLLGGDECCRPSVGRCC
ncbi:MAG TPA: hypothetical protein VET85_06020 [Stellaceae bacterium]|nr:hypothetical protein [Stellaceae bacterium]